MITKDEGLILLTDIVTQKTVHQDYTRVTELADKYYKLFTGDDIEELLLQIVTRETDDEFEQRRRITKSVIPSTLNSTKLPFHKAVRKSPIKSISYQSQDDNRVKELENKLGVYWGERSLEEYLEYVYIDYNYQDPNAFLITEFSDFDPKIEKASPYPFIATSVDAVMYEYKNEILQYLVVKLPIKFVDTKIVDIASDFGTKKEEQEFDAEGFKYTMYLGNDTIQFTQVGKETFIPEGLDTIQIGPDKFMIEYFTPKATKVPAVRLGYIRDAETKGRTFVSVFHSVMLLLEKGLKTDSELDLSIALTAFPAMYKYLDRCSEPDCRGGKLLDGITECKKCKGTGWASHNSVMDVITLTLPRTPDEMFDLERMEATKYGPIELLQFMSDYVDKLTKWVFAKMFNGEVYTQSDVQTASVQTATQKLLEVDNMNDTLFAFTRNYSAIWKFIVTDIAVFTDNGNGLILSHKFPYDLKFKGLNELMLELKSARDAGASTSTISAIEDDINEILYTDRPAELKKIRTKNIVNPFRGYNEADVRLIISQGLTTEANAVLYSNLESIFNELELEDSEIYDMAIDIIVERVKLKTTEYIVQMKAEEPAPVQQPF